MTGISDYLHGLVSDMTRQTRTAIAQYFYHLCIYVSTSHTPMLNQVHIPRAELAGHGVK